MHNPYNEKYCRICPFKGETYTVNDGSVADGMIYIDCQRDNEDAKKRFDQMLKDENDVWLRQEAEFMHCICYEEFKRNM